jgi:Na+-transporting NADH:ubiquinone oxidoreductase subunit E
LSGWSTPFEGLRTSDIHGKPPDQHLCQSVFVGNILLAYFLGMCSFLAVSKNLQTSTGAGCRGGVRADHHHAGQLADLHFLLAPGALAWAGLPDVDLSFLKLVLFIAVIAGMVQVVEMVIDRYSQALYNALGVFLPLITVNCAILGASLFMVERSYTFSETVVYGVRFRHRLGPGHRAMATIKMKLRYADVPEGLQGFGINMITSPA